MNAMTNDTALIQVWRENLLTDFKQSLLWDATPYTDPNRIDFIELQADDHQFGGSFVRQLLDAPQHQVTFSPVPSLARKVKHFYHEAKTYEQEHGGYPLRFGYPLVIQQDPQALHKHLAAPLLLWEVRLRPHPTEADDWILERLPHAPIQINPLLDYHLRQQYDLHLAEVLRDGLAQQQLTQLDVLKAANEISLKAGFTGHHNVIDATLIPSIDTIQQLLSDGGGIVWSGIVGLIAPQGVGTLDVLDAMIPTDEAELDTEAPTQALTEAPSLRDHDLSPLHHDPYQSAIVRSLSQHSRVAVRSAYGTGKTQAITGLSANLLANRRKVLVIGSKVAALQRIQNRMDRLGLGDLSFVVKDPHHDKAALAEAIYQSSLSARKLPAYEEEEFQHLLNRTMRLRQQLDTAHGLFSTPLFEEAQWTELIGQFLANQRKAGKHLLNSHVQPQDYAFTPAEYHQLIAILLEAQPLYQALNTLKHPLRALSPSLFTDQAHEEAKAYTTQTLNQMLKAVDGVYQQFAVQLTAYRSSIEAAFEQYYQLLKVKIAEVRADIADYQKQYGADFNEYSVMRNLRMQLFGVFSKRLTNILRLKRDVKDKYNDIEGVFDHERYFAYSFPKVKGTLTFDKLSDNLNDFEQALEDWKKGTPTLIQQEIERLNTEHVNDKVDFKNKVTMLQESFKALIEQLNGHALLQKKFYSDAQHIAKQREYLEEVTETLENLQYNLRDFDAYYHWMHFWLGLSKPQQGIVKALILTKPDDWQAALKSWYFHHVIGLHASTDLLTDYAVVEEYTALHHQLKDFLPKKALKYWKLKQTQEVRRIKRESKFLFNAFFGKSRQQFVSDLNVRVLFDTEFELLTNMFPVLLMTPAVASQWLPMIEKYFDTVIIDDAANLQIEEVAGALWRGQHHLVIGDQLHIGKTMTASVLTYALQAGYQVYDLPLFHKTIDQRLWDFKNHLFYKGQLQILPSKRNHYPDLVKAVAVEGVYISVDHHNQEEAQQIMRLLNEVEPQKNGRFPSIGIVCMTKEQRNLIRDYIYQIKQQKIAGNERIAQLELGGLGVYYYRDIHHHQFDIAMVSTTFAPDVSGHVHDRITSFDEWEGLDALNALVTIARQRLYVLSSLTPDHRQTLQQRYADHAGVQTFLQFIAYTEAIDEEATLRQLLPSAYAAPHSTPTAQATFVQEVATALKPYLEPGRLQTHVHIDALLIDLYIAPLYPDQPAIAFQCDADFWRYPLSDYAWEHTLKQQLQGMNIVYQPIWSAAFWREPEMAAKQLAATIIKHDDKHTPPPPVAAVTETDALAPADDDASPDAAEEVSPADA